MSMSWRGRIHTQSRTWLLLGSVLTAAAAIVLLGCRSTNAAQPTASSTSSTVSLSRCVARWNSAVLGNGRSAIRGVAGSAQSALMSSSRDGVCALAFPMSAGYTNGGGVYFSLLDGDYDMRSTPVSGIGSPSPPVGGEEVLRGPAKTQANVEVSPQTGLISARSDGTSETLPYTLLDYGRPCRTIIDPTTRRPIVPNGYKVMKSTAGCGWTRSLIFAYERHEGSLLGHGHSGAPIRRLAGWRCSGLGPFPPQSTAEVRRFRIRCVRGGQVAEARGARGHVLGAGSGHVLGS